MHSGGPPWQESAIKSAVIREMYYKHFSVVLENFKELCASNVATIFNSSQHLCGS